MKKGKELARLDQTKIEKKLLPEITIEEERYDLEKDDALIKYEFNMIELPFFTKDDRIGKNVAKKYNFTDDSFMEVAPSYLPESGQKIPQEFDEKIFYAILRLYYRHEVKKIKTTIYELLALAGMGEDSMGMMYGRARESILRLQGTSIICKNILYDAEKRKRLTDARHVRILQSARIVKMDSLDEKERNEMSAKKSVKEVVIIELSDFIEQNIAAKGYLSYDAEKLIEIDNGTARKMYLLIEKWRGWEKTDVIRRSCRFLASRIPLSWEDKNISGTIRVIERAAKELKTRGLIGDYQLVREGKTKNTEVLFFFEGATTTARILALWRQHAQQSVETGHEGLQITGVEYDERQVTIFDAAPTSETTNGKATAETEESALIELLPKEARTKNILSLVSTYYRQHGREYMLSNIEYCVKNARDFGDMFPSALQKDYGEKLRLAQSVADEANREERERRFKEKESLAEGVQKRKAFELWWKSLGEKKKAEVDRQAKQMAQDQAVSESMMDLAMTVFRRAIYDKQYSGN